MTDFVIETHTYDSRNHLILSHQQGIDIRKSSFEMRFGKMKYRINVASMFHPMQLYSETKDPRLKEHVIDTGGDIFCMFKRNNLLQFLVMDVKGHGLEASLISKQLLRIAKRHISDVNLLDKISHYVEKQTNKMSVVTGAGIQSRLSVPVFRQIFILSLTKTKRLS